MNLSDNFSLAEFLHSQTAEREGGSMYEQQMNPSTEIIENLRHLCLNAVQPLRTLLETPMFISSGYRCKDLNTAIKGSKTSQHMKGQAADIVLSDSIVKNESKYEIRHIVESQVYQRTGKWLRSDVNANFYLFAVACIYLNELDIDQLIHEYGKPGAPSWIHISSSKERNTRQILILPQSKILSLEEALMLGCE